MYFEESVRSALHQEIPSHLLHHHQTGATSLSGVQFDVVVCCYDDASTDKSLELLYTLKEDCAKATSSPCESKLLSATLLIGTAPKGTSSRGAGYARNQAVKLRQINNSYTNIVEDDVNLFHFLCVLDSDDIMHPTRIAEQTSAMLSLGYDGRKRKHLSENALMGCQFDRIPSDSTWHYAKWANSLTDERVRLERFRECTLLQPTWFLSKSWFESLGGWFEAPTTDEEKKKLMNSGTSSYYRLVHSSELAIDKSGEMSPTLRLAEDTRFFYAHLRAGGTLHLHRTSIPLVSYRHRVGMSQSSCTPRKLLMNLRAKAWEDIVFSKEGSNVWSKRGFAIWGAGRDGKDFLKALTPEVASQVVCFVDVDYNKIEKIKLYNNPLICRTIPILHFSTLANDSNTCSIDRVAFGRVNKEKMSGDSFDTISQKDRHERGQRQRKKPKTQLKVTEAKPHATLDPNALRDLPVVVTVAMYRTNGALESNVASIGRIEGENLWHIS